MLGEILLMYCMSVILPAGKWGEPWKQNYILWNKVPETSLADQEELKKLQYLCIGGSNAPKRCIWADQHLEWHQCYWRRSKGESKAHQGNVQWVEQYDIPNFMQKGQCQCSLLESGSIFLYIISICQKAETFLIFFSSLYIARFEATGG